MSLIRHSALNLMGNFLPAMVSLPAYGYLARALGVEAFGIYTLAIIVIGYAGIFDAGLTRSIVREIALYRGDKSEQNKVIACGTVAILIFSFIAMLVMYLSAPSIVDMLNISAGKQIDAIKAISILTLSIPVFLLNQIWLSILEGNEDFLQLNIQRSIGSLFVAGVPVTLVLWEGGIVSAILGLFVARVIVLFISAVMVKDEIKLAGLSFDYEVFKRLINFGGWSALTGIISPVMVYFDRFIISNMLGVQNVALYSAPADLISRGLLIPNALSRSIFPKLISAKDEQERTRLRSLAYKLIFSVCGFSVVLGFFLSKFVMTFWMGDAFSREPVTVLKILLIGFMFASLSQIPFANIQSKGMSKLTAMVHLIEIIPYLVLLYFLINSYGVIGAAISWSLRLTLEFFILNWLSDKLNKGRVTIDIQ